ncbi:MAG: carbohydrate ABC transporter permease [Clostridia bacterium]|nr:carbohydrate ABC transporter permease [Clostridia bacterium]
MLDKPTWQQRIFGIVNGSIMIILMIVMFYPVWYVFCASFSNANEFIAYDGVLLLPIKPTIAAYEGAFRHPLIFDSYLNTLFIVIVGTALSTILTAIAAYFMSRKNVFFKRPISLMIIFTMYFNGGLVPLYLIVKNLGLLDSIASLILPSLLSVYNIVVMRAGFDSLPDSIEESAKIDGAGHIIILFRILLPIVLPTVAVIILYYGVSYWNAWFNASIFMKSRNKFPLQLVLRQILLENETNEMSSGIDTGDQMALSETIKHAVTMIATIPVLCLYPLLQKYFIKGIMIGAVKG